MKRLLLSLFAMFGAMAFTYLAFGFYYLTLDPHLWSAAARIFYIYFGLIAGGAAGAITHINCKP